MLSFIAALPKASFAILLALFVAILPNLVRGDDLTGQSQDDPKDLLPAPVQAPRPQSTGLGAFQPLPGWARGVVMPSLPEQLKPMGKKAVLVTPPTPAHAPLAPPPDTTSASSDAAAKAKAAPAESNPDLITVSPFLQWIKSNPQAAAAEARQQANSYHASPPPDAGSSSTSTGPVGNSNPATTSAPEDNYWLPPLIDSADFGPQPVTGSAAIYSTPQR